MFMKTKNIAGSRDPPEIKKFSDRFFTQSLDVERAARHEMAQPLEALGGANESRTASHVDLAHFCVRLAAALRAMIGKHVSLARFVSRQILDHLWDHISRTLDPHAVPHAQAQPRNLVAIVERDVGDDHPADPDRL